MLFINLPLFLSLLSHLSGSNLCFFYYNIIKNYFSISA